VKRLVLYTFYRLGAAGHVVTTGEVACADDASARKVVALSLAPHETAELWAGIRHVGKITGAEPPNGGDPPLAAPRPSGP
jgi:hypothetical protein